MSAEPADLLSLARRAADAAVATVRERPSALEVDTKSSSTDMVTQMDRAAEEEHDAQGRRFVEPCGRCAHQPHCLGVRNEYVELFGDRGLEPLKA